MYCELLGNCDGTEVVARDVPRPKVSVVTLSGSSVNCKCRCSLENGSDRIYNNLVEPVVSMQPQKVRTWLNTVGPEPSLDALQSNARIPVSNRNELHDIELPS
jgi:hypothetical protein